MMVIKVGRQWLLGWSRSCSMVCSLKYFMAAISEAIKTNANFAHINQNVSHFVFTHVFALEKFLSWAENSQL